MSMGTEEPKICDTMKDGTVYAGISPDTGKAMYVMPDDAPLAMQWKRAMDYAVGLDAFGYGLAHAQRERAQCALRESRGDRRIQQVRGSSADVVLVFDAEPYHRTWSALQRRKTAGRGQVGGRVSALRTRLK